MKIIYKIGALRWRSNTPYDRHSPVVTHENHLQNWCVIAPA